MTFLTSFWWALFPLAFFAIGGLRMWLNYRRSRDVLEVIKTYAAQGKEPPAEVMRMLAGSAVADDDGYDDGGGWNGGWGWRGRRHGPYAGVQRVVMFAAFAIGFGVAAWWTDQDNVRLAFGLVAFVMGSTGLGSLILLLLQLRDRRVK